MSTTPNALRDIFIGNDSQTPYFVYQGTGRETLVDDVTKLANFRKQLAARLDVSHDEVGDVVGNGDVDEGVSALVFPGPPTVMQLLGAAEEKTGSPEEAKELIDELFDGLLTKTKEAEFAEFFRMDVTEHPRYYEPTIEEFMIRVLSREKRPDRLVTAEAKRATRKPSLFDAATANLLFAMGQEIAEHFTLELNCSLERAQLKVMLTPKYRTLQRLALVLSCAPSLEQCYIFEMVTQHPRTDWDAFDDKGEEVVRRWYKLDWGSDTAWLTRQICDGLKTAVRNHIDGVTKRLANE